MRYLPTYVIISLGIILIAAKASGLGWVSFPGGAVEGAP